MKQGFLFADDVPDAPTDSASDADTPLFIFTTEDGQDWGDFESCLTTFGTNQCTLDGLPARIIGSPRSAPYATIEPVEFDHDPIHCCWDVVDMVMQDGGAFTREDDDTDE
jgi:hypothetical protein